LVTWNVAGRRTRLPEQVEVVLGTTPDVVCLQEVTVNSLPQWREALTDAGLVHSATPLDSGTPPKPRRLGVLIASRAPLEPLDPPPDLPWFERVQAAVIGGVEVVSVHSPISPSPHLAKVLTHEALYAWLHDRPGPIVVAGDLNTPRRDLPDGTCLTFAHESNGSLREERGERWAAAERALVQTLRLEHGWRDPFLEQGGERTWTWKGNKGGWRLDHILVKGLDVGARAYAHEWRMAGLSDHSALVADLVTRRP
jgi:exonuclease III